MKFRQGFVSNSSTTSFCICGISTNEEQLEDWLKDKVSEEEKEEDDYEVYDIVEELCDKEGLSVHAEPDSYYSYWIGLDIQKLDDNETLKDFKNKTKEKLKRIFGDNIDKKIINIIEKAWHDG